jgi:gluconolactonase
MNTIPNSWRDRFMSLIRSVLHAACFCGLMIGGFLLATVQNAGAVKFSISDLATFTNLINTNAVFTTNVTYNSQIEGPVWIPNGQYLVFSDMGNNRLEKLVPPNTLAVFFQPSVALTIYNGNILDLQERQLSCLCGTNGLAVAMTTNGVATDLVTTCNGLRFYSPNDPGYNSGISLPPPTGPGGPAGFPPGLWVYRFYETNPGATVSVVATNVAMPNGICFSPDETKLYVADNGPHGGQGMVRVFSVTSSNTLTGGTVLFTVSQGIADGIRCDVNGNIWAASGDGVEIYGPDGHLIGKIVWNVTLSNLCFGGPQYKTLYTTGQPYVCSFPVLIAGAVSDKKLTVGAAGTNVCVSWPAPSTGFGLQKSDALGSGADWSSVTDPVGVTNGLNQLGVSPTNAAKFYRLLLN